MTKPILKKLKNNRNKSILFVELVWVLIVFISLTSCDSCTKRTRQEPYTVIEEKQITLTYIVDKNKIYYSRKSGTIIFGENPELEAFCYVTNTSDYSGVFKFYAVLSSQGNVVRFEDEKYIASGSTVRLSENKEINPFSFETNVEVDSWGIIPPEKIINVEVTKYRTVEY